MQVFIHVKISVYIYFFHFYQCCLQMNQNINDFAVPILSFLMLMNVTINSTFGLFLWSNIWEEFPPIFRGINIRCVLKTAVLLIWKLLFVNPNLILKQLFRILTKKLFFLLSFAGSSRLEICSSGSWPNLPMALPHSISCRFNSDFYSRFEDVAA